MSNDKLSLTFHGAARQVTGSAHLVEYGGFRMLLDCGLVAGKRKEAFEQNRHPFVPPESVDAIVLSHAHLDHSGNLPTFVRQGFRGKIYATPATTELCDVMMRDSANVQTRQVELVNRLRREEGRNPFEPLYDENDVARTMSHFRPLPYDRTEKLRDGLGLTFRDAGHILGSAVSLIEFGGNGAARRLLYTGDLGRKGCAILRDPAPVASPDYVIAESTYGDRTHASCAVIKDQLAEAAQAILERKSRLIIPAFSVGKVQAIIYHFHQLYDEGRIPRLAIHVDSPLGRKATEIFRRHPECYDAEANEYMLHGERPFSFGNLHYAETVEDSKKLNNQRGPLVIISSSGMCEGGRVLHHLVHSVEDADNIILLTGFQAPHTLGRKLHEGVNPVNILGRPHQVRARVMMMEAFSAHADAEEMAAYFTECRARPVGAFLVHGEVPQAEALRRRLMEGLRWPDVAIPEPGERFELASGG